MNIPVKFKQGILIGSFATDPDIYDEGQIYWNTTYKTFRQSNGIVWSDLKPTPAEFISTDAGQTAVLGSDDKILVPASSGSSTALQTTYDNSDSNLSATNVKAALDELDSDIAAVAGGFQGDLAISDTPSIDGYYFATESGTYTNAGSVVSDLSQGLNIITKIGSNYGLIIIPVSQGGGLNYDLILNKLNTEDTVLSIPFFDSTYVSATELKNSVNPENGFDSTVGGEGIVGDGFYEFTATTKFLNQQDLVLPKFINYFCLAFNSINTGDRILLGKDNVLTPGSYLLLRNATLNVIISAGSYSFNLPAGFNRSQPFIIQITSGIDLTDTKAWINGQPLTQSSSRTQEQNPIRIDNVGLNNVNTGRVPIGKYVHYKVSYKQADHNELNTDLLLLANVANVENVELITNETKPKVNVFVLAGQSNAGGRASLSELTTIVPLAFSERHKLWDKATKRLYSYGLQNSTSTFFTSNLDMLSSTMNSCSQFARIEDTYVVKHGPGGTSFLNNEWNQGDDEYEILKDAIIDLKQKIQSEGKEPNFIMMWFHGETDGDFVGSANNYQTALTNFLNALKTDISEPEMKVIIYVLANEQTASVPFITTIQTAQRDVAASSANYYAFECTGNSLRDASHYSAASNINISNETFELLINNNLLKFRF